MQLHARPLFAATIATAKPAKTRANFTVILAFATWKLNSVLHRCIHIVRIAAISSEVHGRPFTQFLTCQAGAGIEEQISDCCGQRSAIARLCGPGISGQVIRRYGMFKAPETVLDSAPERFGEPVSSGQHRHRKLAR